MPLKDKRSCYGLPVGALGDIGAAHERLVQRHPEFSDYCSGLLAYDTWYLTVVRIPQILDMVAQVLGEDIAHWSSSFVAKPARVGSRTPWHRMASTCRSSRWPPARSGSRLTLRRRRMAACASFPVRTARESWLATGRILPRGQRCRGGRCRPPRGPFTRGFPAPRGRRRP